MLGFMSNNFLRYGMNFIFLLLLLVCTDAFACKYDNSSIKKILDQPLESKFISVITTQMRRGSETEAEGVIHKKWGEGKIPFLAYDTLCSAEAFPLGSYLILSDLNKIGLTNEQANVANSITIKLEYLSKQYQELLLKITKPDEIIRGQVNQFWSFCDKENDCIKTSNKCAVNSKFKDRYEKYISTRGHSKECPVNDLNDNPVVKCEDNFCK